jgi:hypothetical protein
VSAAPVSRTRTGPWGEGDPIIVFGDDWGRSVSTMQHLFRHLSLTYPVVWVNGIGHRAPTLTMRDMQRAVQKVMAMAKPKAAKPVSGSGITGGGVPVAVIEPRGVLPWHQIGAVHGYNTRLLVRLVRERLAALGLTRPPLLVTGTPPSVGVLGQLGETASIYFCMDDFLHFPGVDADMIAPLEKRLLERIDATVATAKSLTVTKRPASGLAYHLPQGVNYDHFSTPQPEPDDLAAVPHPRIGFAGTVGGCCDLRLVKIIAERFPQCSIVLVGIIKADQATMDSLKLPNVFVYGPKPYAQLPAYVQHFDVGIIPYTLSDYTLAVDPLKLLEYLAAGIPVVTSNIPEVAKYAEHVQIAPDDETFLAAIGHALTLDRAATRAAGQAVARGHTWTHRTTELLRIIGEVVAKRGK